MKEKNWTKIKIQSQKYGCYQSKKQKVVFSWACQIMFDSKLTSKQVIVLGIYHSRLKENSTLARHPKTQVSSHINKMPKNMKSPCWPQKTFILKKCIEWKKNAQWALNQPYGGPKGSHIKTNKMRKFQITSVELWVVCFQFLSLNKVNI
jgi:hypothetical protein